MKYAVIYQSRSGNTRLIAERIYQTLDTSEKELIDLDITSEVPKADVYFVGFGVHDYFCSIHVLNALDQITSGRIGLFATCGYLPAEQYKANLEKRLDVWMPEGVDYLGMFLCQGKVEADQKKKMIEQLPDREKELKHMFKIGKTHPDQEDLEEAEEFAMAMLEKIEGLA